MFTIEDKRYEYIPIQYNLFQKKFDFEWNQLNEEFIEQLLRYCNKNIFYIWDFLYIDTVEDRKLLEPCAHLIKSNKNVIFSNVKRGTVLDSRIREGLNKSDYQVEYNMDNIHYIIGENTSKPLEYGQFQDINAKYLDQVIQEYCIEERYGYLESSGVFSNMRINLKNMFYRVKEFKYAVYLLAKMVTCHENVDGLIATSKNGTAFASVIGDILGLKVLYFNIGQMFEETYNCSPKIKMGETYIHIYDMICVGSETKVLNALVNAQGGSVLQSIGIVCLPDLEIVKKMNSYSSMNHVECLINQKQLSRKYEIYLERAGN